MDEYFKSDWRLDVALNCNIGMTPIKYLQELCKSSPANSELSTNKYYECKIPKQ
jgi:hypothetical protein